jgi:hypothetical protein
MHTWSSGNRAALLLASGLLLWSLATTRVSAPSAVLAQTTDHQGHMTDGAGPRGGHQMGSNDAPTDRQQMIHQQGASVMPFDLDQTQHHFQLLPDGGLQTVLANDPTNQTQITLTQQHLADLTQRFQQGDFSEPASLHGGDMPGLSDLAAAGSRLQVAYTTLPDGAQLRFTTQDPTTLTALQQWFAAQLADHGSDAVAH